MDFEDRNLIWLTFQRLFTPKLKPGEDWAKESGLVWGGGRGGCCPLWAGEWECRSQRNDNSGWHSCPSSCKWLVVVVVNLTLEPMYNVVLGCYLVFILFCDSSKAFLKSCDETFLNFSHI